MIKEKIRNEKKYEKEKKLEFVLIQWEERDENTNKIKKEDKTREKQERYKGVIKEKKTRNERKLWEKEIVFLYNEKKEMKTWTKMKKEEKIREKTGEI